MACCKHSKNIKRPAFLIFKRAELLYDAENYSFVEADILSSEENEHVRHQIADIGQEGNIDRVTRILNLAHSEVVEMLYPYTKETLTDDVILDDTLIAPEEYVIILDLPEGFSITTLNLLRDMVHEYLVCKVLSDWMSITNPQSRLKWDEKFQSLREMISTCLTKRRGRIRRKLKPF